MSDPKQSPTESSRSTAKWQNAVFTTLGNPKRRVLLFALAKNPWQPASKLRIFVGLTLDATMKHLSDMRSQGLLVMKRDSVDIRRRLYALSPSVPPVTVVDGRHAIDFGFCIVRF